MEEEDGKTKGRFTESKVLDKIVGQNAPLVRNLLRPREASIYQIARHSGRLEFADKNRHSNIEFTHLGERNWVQKDEVASKTLDLNIVFEHGTAQNAELQDNCSMKPCWIYPAKWPIKPESAHGFGPEPLASVAAQLLITSGANLDIRGSNHLTPLTSVEEKTSRRGLQPPNMALFAL